MSIDLTSLKEQCDGDLNRMKLYIDTYIEAVNEQLPLLAEAIKESDSSLARKVAHTLKPLFTIIGFNALWEEANEIETRVDLNKDLSSIQSRSIKFEKSISNSLEAIKQASNT